MIALLAIIVVVVGGGLGLVMLHSHVEQELFKIADAEKAKLDSLSNVKGFHPAVVFEGLKGSYGLGLDPVAEMFGIAIPGHSLRLYHFSQLIAVEIVRDGQTVTKTNGKIDAKSAALATALIGPLGMAAGAKTSSTSVSSFQLSRLSLKIFVNDLHTPCFEIPFLSRSVGMGGIDDFVQTAANNLDAWFGRFQTILIGMERRPDAYDTKKAITHALPAPPPVAPQVSWAGRTFAP